MIAQKGSSGKGCQDRTAITGQTGHECRDRTAGQPGQDSQYWTAKTVLPGQDCQDNTTRTGLRGNESKGRTAVTGKGNQEINCEECEKKITILLKVNFTGRLFVFQDAFFTAFTVHRGNRFYKAIFCRSIKEKTLGDSPSYRY
jgi:hypothetical protein